MKFHIVPGQKGFRLTDYTVRNDCPSSRIVALYLDSPQCTSKRVFIGCAVWHFLSASGGGDGFTQPRAILDRNKRRTLY